MPDLVIRAGLVIDGLGSLPRTADIAVRDGMIAEVGRVRDRAHRVIDADGALVVPGLCALLPPGEVAGFDRNRQHHRAPGVTTAIETVDASIAASQLPHFLESIAPDRFVVDRAFLFDQGRTRAEVGGNRVRDQLEASEGEVEEIATMLTAALGAGVLGVFSTDPSGPAELLRLLEAEESGQVPLALIQPDGLVDDDVWEMAQELHRARPAITVVAGLHRPVEHDRIMSAIRNPDADASLNDLFEPPTAIPGSGLNPLAMLPLTRTSDMTPVDVAGRWLRLAEACGLADRGRIQSDAKADLNVLDHFHLTDDLQTGVVSTIVSVEEIVSFDELAGALPGQLVRARYEMG